MPSRRRALHLGSLVLASVAGCLGTPGEGADRGTSTQSDGSTSKETPTTPTDTGTTTAFGARTPTETVDPPAVEVVEYETLTPKQQAAFDDALDGPERFSNSLPNVEYDLDVAQVFETYRFVLKDGTYYRVKTEGPRIVAGGTGVSVERIDTPGNESVVRLNESTGGELVRKAIENGGHADGRSDLSGPFEDGTVVEYEGQYYRITRVHTVDYGALTLWVYECSGPRNPCTGSQDGSTD